MAGRGLDVGSDDIGDGGGGLHRLPRRPYAVAEGRRVVGLDNMNNYYDPR